MRTELERLMSRYGTDMTVTGIFGEIAIRGFFQAVNTKSWQSMESVRISHTPRKEKAPLQ